MRKLLTFGQRISACAESTLHELRVHCEHADACLHLERMGQRLDYEGLHRMQRSPRNLLRESQAGLYLALLERVADEWTALELFEWFKSREAAQCTSE